MNKKQGGNFAALSPTDFIAAVTQLIPELVRYYAWYSNKARLGAFVPRRARRKPKTLLKAMNRRPARKPGSPKRARTSERSPKRR
jgi:hypothetical protein